VLTLAQGFVFVNNDPEMVDSAGQHAKARNTNLNEDLGKVRHSSASNSSVYMLMLTLVLTLMLTLNAHAHAHARHLWPLQQIPLSPGTRRRQLQPVCRVVCPLALHASQ